MRLTGNVNQASPEIKEVSETIEGTSHTEIYNRSPDIESHDTDSRHDVRHTHTHTSLKL